MILKHPQPTLPTASRGSAPPPPAPGSPRGPLESPSSQPPTPPPEAANQPSPRQDRSVLATQALHPPAEPSSSLSPALTIERDPEMKKLEVNKNVKPMSSPSATPSWAGCPPSPPAAGRRSSKPRSELESSKQPASNAPEKIEIRKDMDQASQHLPGLDRDADQQGARHQKQQGPALDTKEKLEKVLPEEA